MQLQETFENTQCPMRHCRAFENLFEKNTVKKPNKCSVISYLIRQEIWGDIWKHTVEKSQTNVTSVITHLHPLVHIIWGLIWEHRMEKLNRALCELGYSLAHWLLLLLKCLLSLLKWAIIESGKPHPPNLIFSLIEKNLQPSQQQLFGLLSKLANYDDDQLKPKIEKLWNDKGVLHDVMH